MTDLTRPVTRKTNVTDDQRSGFRKLVVRIEGQGVRIRPAKTQKWYFVDWKTVYIMGIRIRRQEILQDRKATKARRKAGN